MDGIMDIDPHMVSFESPDDLGLTGGEAQEPTDAELRNVMTLGRRLVHLEDRKVELEEELKRQNEEIQLVREKDLPAAMAACGMTEFVLQGGTKLKEALVYRGGQLDDAPDEESRKRKRADGSIGRPLAQRLEALDWVDSSGNGTLIKNQITILVPREHADAAREIVQLIKSHRVGNQLDISQRRAVLAQTLQAFCREQDEHHNEPPLELLGVNKVRSVKVTRPKETIRD